MGMISFIAVGQRHWHDMNANRYFMYFAIKDLEMLQR